MRRALLTTLLLVLAAGAPAAARIDPNYSFQLDLTTSARAGEDASLIQFALPRKTTVRAAGRTRTVRVVGFTISGPEGPTTIVKRLRGKYPQNNVAMVERPLTTAEKRYAGSQLVWIDGDVLIVHPQNALCAAGSSLADIRTMLRGTAKGYAPAGLTGDPERLFGVTRYGSGIKTVNEASAISSIAGDPQAFAAVAWSAAREEIEAGQVCAVPIGGITPSEATLRDRSYPAAVHATFAYSKTVFKGWRAYQVRWYKAFLRSAKIKTLLESARGRKRLLP
jgi:hypothetical protein